MNTKTVANENVFYANFLMKNGFYRAAGTTIGTQRNRQICPNRDSRCRWLLSFQLASLVRGVKVVQTAGLSETQ